MFRLLLHTKFNDNDIDNGSRVYNDTHRYKCQGMKEMIWSLMCDDDDNCMTFTSFYALLADLVTVNAVIIFVFGQTSHNRPRHNSIDRLIAINSQWLIIDANQWTIFVFNNNNNQLWRDERITNWHSFEWEEEYILIVDLARYIVSLFCGLCYYISVFINHFWIVCMYDVTEYGETPKKLTPTTTNKL